MTEQYKVSETGLINGIIKVYNEQQSTAAEVSEIRSEVVMLRGEISAMRETLDKIRKTQRNNKGILEKIEQATSMIASEVPEVLGHLIDISRNTFLTELLRIQTEKKVDGIIQQIDLDENDDQDEEYRA